MFAEPCSVGNVLRLILLFDWNHPSVPTCTRCLPSRAAAVKDEPVFPATASAARSVLDGREHGGMLARVGDEPFCGVWLGT